MTLGLPFVFDVDGLPAFLHWPLPVTNLIDPDPMQTWQADKCATPDTDA